VESTAGAASSASDGPPRDELTPGAQLDTYVVRRKLGQGGMGVVYEADDQTLRRKAAIKILRREDAGAMGLRLIDEATKQSKLTHANVVTVYTAKRIGEQVFIAMEFMAGGTLADWLKGPRKVENITRKFLAAGQGLAAAHAAGLVHRDFKPENVLLDADGEPHVSDFGLADLAEDGRVKGRLAGTHGFMAPEQERGDTEIDHRADQYAFCVSLYSALYKEMPPRPGEPQRSLRPQSTANLLAVPLWLRRVVLKGLSPNRDDRYPSMKALLLELANDPARKRRQRVLATLAGASLAGSSALIIWQGVREKPEQHAEHVCIADVTRDAQALWSVTRRGKAEVAFQRELASGVWAQVHPRLTAEVMDWSAAAIAACRLPPSDPIRSCLEERKKTLDSMGQLFSEADHGVVTNAINTVMLEVQPAVTCQPQAAAGRSASPSPADDDEARKRLARVRVLRAAAKYVPALEEAMTVKHQAEDLEAPELLAEAQLAVGELYADQLADGAEEYLLNAIFTAESVGKDELRARAWIALLGWSSDRDKVEQAQLARREAHALLTRLGGRPTLEAAWYTAVGRLAARQDDVEGARAAFLRALELRQDHFTADHPLVLRSRLNWASALPADDPRRMSELNKVLEARAKLFGPRHAETVDAMLALARTQVELHACDRARDLFADAVSASLDRVEENPLDAGGAQIELALAYDCLGQTRDAHAAACEGLKLLRKGGASVAELDRVESLLRDLEKKVTRPTRWTCEATPP
jgi:hypothetical protein